MILTGWKKICEYFGVKDRRTMLRKIHKYYIPVLYMGGRPTICTEMIARWWARCYEMSDTFLDIQSPYDKKPQPDVRSKLEKRVVEAIGKDLRCD